ncbi:hypothetical protein AV530_007824 [Patagioenas fasciata monilis]|uniref:Uncharacterized protein n=1 Tax=Patagioenas fasciata monilis TaxID=372326 RepID=A0A1V4JSX9_PATFA|nr:hypothetical protein AV530_007824 [Patagioenas fasciata monilis]
MYTTYVEVSFKKQYQKPTKQTKPPPTKKPHKKTQPKPNQNPLHKQTTKPRQNRQKRTYGGVLPERGL